MILEDCGPFVPPEGGEIEATLVVKAAPERSAKYGETVCTAALFDNGRMIRLYPVPWDTYRSGRFPKWTRIQARVEPSDERAARPESHKLRGPMTVLPSPLAGRPAPWKERLALVGRAVSPGGMHQLRAIQERTKKSLGAVRVRELTRFRVTAPLDEIVEQADYRVSEQKTLTGEPIMEGSRIDKLKHVFRFEWRCWGPCCADDAEGQGYHDTTCEDWELFESFRSWRRRYERDEDFVRALRQKYFDQMGQTDLHFFMGTPSDPKTQNSWMIVGLFYPFLKAYDPSKPSLCAALDDKDVLVPDSRYDRVENEDAKRASPAGKPKGARTLLDY